MKTSRFVTACTILAAWMLPVQPIHAANRPEFASDVKKLADGFQFTEGPAADQSGNVFFSDIPNNRIHKWSTDGTLSTFLENSGGINGLYFDKHGNLIACAGGTGRVVSIDPQGTVSVVADSYQGRPFNSPNDLWLDDEGGIYFTDPRYGSRDNLPQDGEHVYYIAPDRGTVTRIIDDMVRPNGLIGTPDGKYLYVADAGAGKTYRYVIASPGQLTEKKLWIEQGSDGVTLDEFGNLYLTGRGVHIFTPAGEPISTIDVPERPSNVCFSPDYGTLYITARTSFYAVDRQKTTFHSFTVDDIDGNPVSLSKYKGKVVLAVNVASKCGFTPQYAGLQKLYETYQDRGFVVLGFPANNFANQEPGKNADIKSFCTENYGVTFPMFAKISVKGDDIAPLYAYLTQENGRFNGPIGWNFNKFLIGPDGQTLARYPSRTEPFDPALIDAIEKALD